MHNNFVYKLVVNFNLYGNKIIETRSIKASKVTDNFNNFQEYLFKGNMTEYPTTAAPYIYEKIKNEKVLILEKELCKEEVTEVLNPNFDIFRDILSILNDSDMNLAKSLSSLKVI